MSEPRRYTPGQQIVCVRREVALRKRVYPKWVSDGRMKAETADHELHCMEAVLETLTLLLKTGGWQ